MATLSTSGGSAAVPNQYTVRVSPQIRGDVIYMPGSNVAIAYVQLPGGKDGAEVTIINHSTLGVRVYPLGSSSIVADGGTGSTSGATGGYMETTDEGGTITLRYVDSGDGSWCVTARTGTWTYA